MSAAATSQVYPTLNDFEPSWADISTKFNVAGGATIQNMIDFKSLKWESKVAEGRWAGLSGGRDMKRTTGKETVTGSCEWSAGGLWRLCTEIAKVAPVRGQQRLLSLVTFDIIILHTPPWTDFIFHEEMRGCRIMNISRAMAEGPDAEASPMDLAPMSCVIVHPDGTEWTTL